MTPLNEESKPKWASSNLKHALGIRNARTRLNSAPAEGATRRGTASIPGWVPVRISLGTSELSNNVHQIETASASSILLTTVNLLESGLRLGSAIPVNGQPVVTLEFFYRRTEL